MKLRREIYAQGNSRDVSVSIEKFLGRPQSVQPFLKRDRDRAAAKKKVPAGPSQREQLGTSGNGIQPVSSRHCAGAVLARRCARDKRYPRALEEVRNGESAVARTRGASFPERLAHRASSATMRGHAASKPRPSKFAAVAERRYKRRMRTTLVVFALSAVSLFAAAPEQKLKPALDTITPDGLLAHIKILSSDTFQGAVPGTEGEDLSVKYISDQFKTIGLEPGNPDGTYTQEVPLAGITSHPTCR